MTTAPEKNAPAREPGAGNGVLAEPEWLEAHLDDPTVRVVEVDVSKLAHEQGHIDGAVLWDIYAELKDASYRLAGPAAMERLLARPASPRTRPSCSTGTGRRWASGS